MIRHFVPIKIVPKFVPILITFVEYHPIRRRFVFVTLDREELKNDNVKRFVWNNHIELFVLIEKWEENSSGIKQDRTNRVQHRSWRRIPKRIEKSLLENTLFPKIIKSLLLGYFDYEESKNHFQNKKKQPTRLYSINRFKIFPKMTESPLLRRKTGRISLKAK